MAGAGEESAKRARKAGARMRRLQRGGGDSDKRRKKMSAVNLDHRHPIYRGVHPIFLLKLLL
jgi:hypothetical protein